MSRLDESLKWLGIAKDQLIPLKERVWRELVRICTKEHRPARAVEIAHEFSRHRNRIIIYLGQLREEGRAIFVDAGSVRGWLPLK